MDHQGLMLEAVRLARQGLGHTAPNPCVGAVLASGGQIMAQGWHRRCGGPHAEREALADARTRGVDPVSCDLYVTLEPCNHHGRTPPCTEAILEAGVRRVYVGVADPNPHVAGGGMALLQERGVEVVCGLAEEICQDLIADFVVWKTTSRTYNVLKMAMTLDGRIAGREGRPEAVSGAAARWRVQALRCRTDAVVVGGDTFWADDPRLTCRLPEGGKDPLAVVVTSRLPQPDDQRTLLRERPHRTLFWTSRELAASPAAQRLASTGVRVWGLAQREGGGLELAEGFVRLRTECGAYATLCEGGGRLAMSLADQRLVDELQLFVAPRLLGDEAARPVFAGGGARRMADALNFRVTGHEVCGQDMLLTLRPGAASEEPCSRD